MTCCWSIGTAPIHFVSACRTRTGELGPEIYFTLPPIRSYLADDLDGDHKTEVVTIAAKLRARGRVALCAKAGRAALGRF
jgi:hypothetical protein